jgi:hypothetical protein
MPPDDRSCFIRIDPSRPSDLYIYDCEGSVAAAKANVRKKLKLIEAAPRKDYSDSAASWQRVLSTGQLRPAILAPGANGEPVPVAGVRAG